MTLKTSTGAAAPLTEETERNKMKKQRNEIKYHTLLCVWSHAGHTPITRRKGQFCDELVRKTDYYSSPDEAALEVEKLLRETEHAYKGFFNMPSFPNQNTRSNWITLK